MKLPEPSQTSGSTLASINHDTFKPVQEKRRNIAPQYGELQLQLAEVSDLVDDIILKKYLHQLTDFEVIPLPNDLKSVAMIRLFKITEMVYQKSEYSTYKFASVFNSAQNLNCNIFIIADSDGKRTDFYMGIRALDDNRTPKSIKDTLQNSLKGQFPGIKTEDFSEDKIEMLLSEMPRDHISAVSCVASNKDADFKNNDSFLQGLEKLARAMQGHKYTAVILAQTVSSLKLDKIRCAYETIYTQLSPFANMQISYGTNTALTFSDAFSHSTSHNSSYTVSHNVQNGTNETHGTSDSHSVSSPKLSDMLLKGVASTAVNAAGILAAPVTGGASCCMVSGALTSLIASMPTETESDTHSVSEQHGTNHNEGHGTAKMEGEGETEGTTTTNGVTNGISDTVQLSKQNKALIDTLERIDKQLKRIDECESIGMWECAAYFLSDDFATCEMAAETYKALMKGERSGVESSSINLWGTSRDKEENQKLPLLRNYITNFIHPAFRYRSATKNIESAVTASSLLSGNELAIQMGLPRQSVCGFPVIEHADFGKEVVSYRQKQAEDMIRLGNVFSMGTETKTNVSLAANSLAMHTFITGSTGAGKSNTVYKILEQVRRKRVPFLVIEPAKGEYKNVFGNLPDVTVYGTNPQKTELLRINPFRFPAGIHVLEHLDRLVEIFNVCWPMYAAMPAVLKSAIEKSYEDCGWDLTESVNEYGDDLYPCFTDVVRNVRAIIDNSEYDRENKGAYKGSLITRLQSLTNGINGLIFTDDEINGDLLFNSNVIIDLSRVGSSETKSLLMGVLVLKLQEFRMETKEMNVPLKHLTVLEEAHNLLKRTSTEQPSEGGNLLGKSVEMISSAIAEMRTYGEGFIIADQAPGLLDMSSIRNTNTKIIMRLPDLSDRELVGKAANLNDDQISELAKLPQGVAAVYQNEWIQPVLCKIDKSDQKEEAYCYERKSTETVPDHSDDRLRIAEMLLNGATLTREVILNDIFPTLRKLKIDASTQVPIAKLLENSLKKTRGTKLAPVMSALFPNVRRTVEQIYFESRNPDEWTESAKSALKCTLKTEIRSKTHSHIIVLIMTDYFQNALGREDELNRWKGSIK